MPKLKNQNDLTVSKFDGDTFVVDSAKTRHEFCVCGGRAAERRANRIAKVFNLIPALIAEMDAAGKDLPTSLAAMRDKLAGLAA